MSEKKIVFFDIDGTIYEFGKGTPESTREAMQKLRENGHIVIICTGRPVSSLFPEVLSLPHDGIISGAGTRVEFGDKVLRNELLPNELLMQTVPRLEKNRLLGGAGRTGVLKLPSGGCTGTGVFPDCEAPGGGISGATEGNRSDE